MFSENLLIGDLIATALSGGIALSILRFWEETAKRGVFDQKTNRKLVHISIGLVFMLCWPMFSSGQQGAILAAFIPGLNIIKMFLLGLGIWKDDATVKSMSRFGDHRELLKGPLYYALSITCACAIYWRYSPISIGVICNLCAGDGIADIVGRRFGKQKLLPAPPPAPSIPHNMSFFDPCYWIYCGEGTCTKNITHGQTCQCKSGYSNLLDFPAFPCFNDCAIGSDCQNWEFAFQIPLHHLHLHRHHLQFLIPIEVVMTTMELHHLCSRIPTGWLSFWPQQLWLYSTRKR